MTENARRQLEELLTDYEEFEIKKEDHPDDESQLFFLLSDFILDIIDLRKTNKISQKEVADRMGTKQASISRFENMNTKPSLEYLYKIAKAVDGELFVTPYGEYTYTVPEEYREIIDKIAEMHNNSVGEFLKRHLTEKITDIKKTYVVESDSLKLNYTISNKPKPKIKFLKAIESEVENRKVVVQQ